MLPPTLLATSAGYGESPVCVHRGEVAAGPNEVAVELTALTDSKEGDLGASLPLLVGS